MVKLTEYLSVSIDSPVAVIGGGASAPSDFRRVPSDCFIISCNEHAYEMGLQPDLFVFLNDPTNNKYLIKYVNNPEGARRVSIKEQYTDILVDICPQFGFTGHFAAWIGNELTSGEVYLCGFDLYGGQNQYFTDKKHERFHDLDRRDLQNSLKRGWEKMRPKFRDRSKIIAFSEPLITILK